MLSAHFLYRIGGIEKGFSTGDINYEAANPQKMTDTRQAKIDGIAVPDLEVDDPTGDVALTLGACPADEA